MFMDTQKPESLNRKKKKRQLRLLDINLKKSLKYKKKKVTWEKSDT